MFYDNWHRILTLSISNRNKYLAEFFPPLPKERETTMVAFTLSLASPVVFVTIGFVEHALFQMYQRYGHPWSLILFGDKVKLEGKAKRRKLGSKYIKLHLYRMMNYLIEKICPKVDDNFEKYSSQFWAMVETERKRDRVSE
jgi:hypothetical protein